MVSEEKSDAVEFKLCNTLNFKNTYNGVVSLPLPARWKNIS